MTAVSDYIKLLEKELRLGNTTEHSFRPALKTFIEAVGGKQFLATNEPKRVKCGAPDFIITQNITPIGHIEAKDIGVNLDKEEAGEQITRYLESLDNLILTDYLEFRWYVLGKHRQTAKIGEVKNGKLQIYSGADSGLALLLEAFLTSQTPTVASPELLAKRMAGMAKIMRDAIRATYKEEGKDGPLHDQMDGFRDILLHELNDEQFADMYAQTICYGLFAARCNHDGNEPFIRINAGRELPKTNPFLKKLFQHIALEMDDGDLPFVWAVDDLAELLNRCRMDEILADFGKRTRQEDPVVHFYETFLKEYDPNLREIRGVYYTPEPVVSYIVRSVDEILRTHFELKDGLANTNKVELNIQPEVKSKQAAKDEYKKEFHQVQILDPATGTGTFLYSVIQHIYGAVGQKNAGLWSGYVRDHLLPRIYGFELLMASYAVAHLKLGLLLKETGYDFKDDERLNVFLTNTLDPGKPFSSLPLFSTFLATEANQASRVKTQAPVMVILGNPPYSGHSANKGDWAKQLLHGVTEDSTKGKLQSYFEVDGHSLNERNSKWLNNDYVKFINFSQWRIEQTGYGVLAFISPHGYLDDPTFNGMRQSLMKTFDEIYVLDLHGYAKKKEISPDGSPDKNVFDIQAGVAIGIFIKKQPTNQQKPPAKVYHSELWGLREVYSPEGEKIGGKYHWLEENSIMTTLWEEVKPTNKKYLFVPHDTTLLPEYEKGWSVNKILKGNVGIVTARDNLCIYFDKENCKNTLKDFSKLPTEEARQKYKLRKDVRDWKVHWAQQELNETALNSNNFQAILYRPFDIRWTYFTGRSKGFHCMPRGEIMKHFSNKQNLGLVTSRLTKGESFHHVQITKNITEVICMSPNTSNNGFVFPLYLYPDLESNNLFESQFTENPGGRRANLESKFVNQLVKILKLKFIEDGEGDLEKNFGPEDVFNYIYAILHSPSYRNRFSDFLKRDFPHIPMPTDRDLFVQLVPLGKKLSKLHLMEVHGPDLTHYPLEGSNTVEAPRYVDPSDQHSGRVYINATQYFEGVPENVWNFMVGGYQVCNKWLKDRKGRTLTYDDLTHYQNIVSALAETITLMASIDQVIDQNGGWPIGPKEKVTTLEGVRV